MDERQAQLEMEELDAWLTATFGELVTGDTIKERVESVITHYITQMGRWVVQGKMPKGPAHYRGPERMKLG